MTNDKKGGIIYLIHQLGRTIIVNDCARIIATGMAVINHIFFNPELTSSDWYLYRVSTVLSSKVYVRNLMNSTSGIKEKSGLLKNATTRGDGHNHI